jgi:hypothetical protein
MQLAIDALRVRPQRFRIRRQIDGNVLFELFSPVPMWARRRWDAVAEPISSLGSLFAYKLSLSELDEELQFSKDALWLEELGR